MQISVKKRKPPVVPIVSLIDILAILLIFFIATSTFKEPKLAVDIEPPQPGTLTTRPVEDKRTTLTISAENLIYLGADEEPVDPIALTGCVQLGAVSIFAHHMDKHLNAYMMELENREIILGCWH